MFIYLIILSSQEAVSWIMPPILMYPCRNRVVGLVYIKCSKLDSKDLTDNRNYAIHSISNGIIH